MISRPIQPPAGTTLLFLGLGSNLGDREMLLRRACEEIEKLIGPRLGQSAFYETMPWGFSSPHPFLNAVLCCATPLSPRAALFVTQQIERQLGRREKSLGGTYHDRTIDIDLLLYGQEAICAPDLRIPHPLMSQRDFVMRPLLDVIQQLERKTYPPQFLLSWLNAFEYSSKKS